MEAQRSNHVRFLVAALGIFVCYFYFGILQERMFRMRQSYGGDRNGTQERFSYVQSFAFCLCLLNYIYALVLERVVFQAKAEDTTPQPYYFGCAMFTLVALLSSNKALSWVDYPTQVVGKSCKPIPVMVFGFLLGGKRYTPLKCLFVLTIVVGVTVFMYKDQKVPAGVEGGGRATRPHVFGLGEVLLLLSLVCDGVLASFQERMKAKYQPKATQMMKSTNLWALASLAVSMVVTMELWEFVAFVGRNPEIVWHLLSASVASALGQYFIYMCISEFGPLPCSLITTTRKFFTVLGSVVLFRNDLSSRQWLGAALVFAGLIMDGVYGKMKIDENNSGKPEILNSRP